MPCESGRLVLLLPVQCSHEWGQQRLPLCHHTSVGDFKYVGLRIAVDGNDFRLRVNAGHMLGCA